MSLPIFKAVDQYLKKFNNDEEFTNFYNNNKESLDPQTTHILNKKYYIEGYRITRIKGQIGLKPVNKNKSNNNNLVDRVNMIEKKIEILNNAIDKLINYINSKSNI